MAYVRWKLADYLQARGLTPYKLVKAIGMTRMNTIYRLARRGDEPTRVDLPTLATVIAALRQITGENVEIGDILEFTEGEPPQPEGSPAEPSGPSTDE